MRAMLRVPLFGLYRGERGRVWYDENGWWWLADRDSDRTCVGSPIRRGDFLIIGE